MGFCNGVGDQSQLRLDEHVVDKPDVLSQLLVVSSRGCFLSVRHLLMCLITNQEGLSFFIVFFFLVVIEGNSVFFFESLHGVVTGIHKFLLDLTLYLTKLLADEFALGVLGFIELFPISGSVSGHLRHVHLLDVKCLLSDIEHWLGKFSVQDKELPIQEI